MDCAKEQSTNPCNHIDKYYSPEPAKTPFIFWVIDDSDLFSFSKDINLEKQTSKKGDICHYNILGLSNKKATDFFDKYGKPTSNPEIYLCKDTTGIPLNQPIENYDELDFMQKLTN